MTGWKRLRGATTVAVAATLMVVASGAEAAAVDWRPRPGMVYLSDMPKDGTTWYGSPAARGWRTPTCGRSWTVPEVNVWSREVYTSETAAGLQNTIVLGEQLERPSGRLLQEHHRQERRQPPVLNRLHFGSAAARLGWWITGRRSGDTGRRRRGW
ncbi:hypothetical protein [Streptomyces sp. NPDC054797]